MRTTMNGHQAGAQAGPSTTIERWEDGLWQEGQPMHLGVDDAPPNYSEGVIAQRARYGILGLSHPEIVRRLIFSDRAVSEPAERPWAYQQKPQLTATQVEALRRLYRAGHTLMELAFEYGVSQTTISSVVRGVNAYGSAS